MTRQDLEKRLQELLEEHQKAAVLQYRLEGAIAVLRELLAQEERDEASEGERLTDGAAKPD